MVPDDATPQPDTEQPETHARKNSLKNRVGLLAALGIGCAGFAMVVVCTVLFFLIVLNRNPGNSEKTLGTFVIDASGGRFEHSDLTISMAAGATNRKLTFTVFR